MRILYYQTKSTEQVEKVFLEGLRQPPSIAHALKPLFLEWLVLSKGISFILFNKLPQTLSLN